MDVEMIKQYWRPIFVAGAGASAIIGTLLAISGWRGLLLAAAFILAFIAGAVMWGARIERAKMREEIYNGQTEETEATEEA